MAALLVTLAAVVAAIVWWLGRPQLPPLSFSGLPEPCRDLTFEGVPYIVCEIDLRADNIEVAYSGTDGKPFGSVEKLGQSMAAGGKPVLLAMNGGMYHQDMAPVGLLVVDGREIAPLNLDDGEGNFFLKPNGVFFIGADRRAGVLESSAYAAAKPTASFATQSGPMLVIDGQIHPKFQENGTSRFIRNGVGVRDPDTVVLAISRSEVSLGSFARLFRDVLACPNALFFDGVVSALWDGSKMAVGGEFPAGPIIAVAAKDKPGP